MLRETAPIEVWLVGLDVPAAVAEDLAGLLDREEQELLAARRSPAASRYGVAHGAARQILGRRLGILPAELRISRRCTACGGPHGRPELPDHPEVKISLSHSGGLALLAISAGPRVGIDVELVRPRPRLARLAERVLTPEELAAWRSRPEPERLRAFLDAWTAKEAYLKAIGEGIRGPLARVPARLPAGWSSSRPDAGAGYVTCLAVESRAVAVRRHVFGAGPARP